MPRITAQRSAHINAPAAKVYAILADYRVGHPILPHFVKPGAISRPGTPGGTARASAGSLHHDHGGIKTAVGAVSSCVLSPAASWSKAIPDGATSERRFCAARYAK